MLKYQIKRKLYYVWGFLVGWFIFIYDIIPRHGEFVEEYGWLAYQPVTFHVFFCAFLFVKLFDASQEIIGKNATRIYQLKVSVVLTIKSIVAYYIVLMFYEHVLGGKPNLLICL